jgi:ankyrin repeat protein
VPLAAGVGEWARDHDFKAALCNKVSQLLLTPRMNDDLDNFTKAIEDNDSTAIKSALLNCVVDANARLPRQFYPPALVHASRYCRVAIVELLLDAGARIDDVDFRGLSACHVAAVHADSTVMRLLVAHRPNLARRDAIGNSALQMAMALGIGALSKRNDDTALLLLQAGAPNDLTDEQMCLLAAASTAAIQVLTSLNIVVGDLRGNFCKTPLHIAHASELIWPF